MHLGVSRALFPASSPQLLSAQSHRCLAEDCRVATSLEFVIIFPLSIRAEENAPQSNPQTEGYRSTG